MKRLLITLFSTGLLLSTLQVRPESQMLNWTKNELSKVAWGQGASAVAGDAKVVGAFVKDALVAGGSVTKDVAKAVINSGQSYLTRNRQDLGMLGGFGLTMSIPALFFATLLDMDGQPSSKQEAHSAKKAVLKYGILPSLALLGLASLGK